MRILTGEVEPTNRGTVSQPRRTGVLSQDQFAFDDERIIDTVIIGNQTLWNTLKERDALCVKENISDSEMNRLGDLESTIADENGYMAELEAAEILRGIRIPDENHTDLMRTLPSDYKFRVLLAQAVYGGPEALPSMSRPTTWTSNPSTGWRNT